MAAAPEVMPPAPRRVEVDFCRGPAGAFLAVNRLVVAGDCTGGGRVVQSFEMAPADLLRALELPTQPNEEQNG